MPPVEQTQIEVLGRGVVKNVDPFTLEKGQTPSTENFVHDNLFIKPRRGLDEYAGTESEFDSTEASAVWNGLYSFKFENDNRFLVAVNYISGSSAGKFYSYDGASWVDRSGTPWPGSAVITDGGNLQPWDFAYGLDEEIGGDGTLFAVNGTKHTYYWNSSSGTPATSISKLSSHGSYSAPTGITDIGARYAMVFAGRLVLGYVNEDGTEWSTRVRVSEINNFAEFNAANGASGVDLAETPGAITGMWTLGEFMYVAKEDALIVANETGDPNTPIVYPTYLDVGCISGRSFQAVSNSNGIFLGTDNVYLVQGRRLEGIGDPIWKDLKEDLNRQRDRQIVSYADYDNNLYYLWLPVGNKDYATRAYVYNWQEQLWFIEDYPTKIYAANSVKLGDATLIGSLTSTIGSYSDVLIGDWGAGGGKVKMVVTSQNPSTNRYYLYTQSAKSYDIETTQGVYPELESREFQLNPGGDAQLRRVDLVYYSRKEVVVEVAVSTNRGWTYPHRVAKTLSPSYEGRIESFHFNAKGFAHRLRIIVADLNFVSYDLNITGISIAALKRELRR